MGRAGDGKRSIPLPAAVLAMYTNRTNNIDNSKNIYKNSDFSVRALQLIEIKLSSNKHNKSRIPHTYFTHILQILRLYFTLPCYPHKKT